MSTLLPQLVEQARAWITDDPDAETRTQLEGILAQAEASADSNKISAET